MQSSVEKQQVLIGAGFAIDVANEEIEPFSEPGIIASRYIIDHRLQRVRSRPVALRSVFCASEVGQQRHRLWAGE